MLYQRYFYRCLLLITCLFSSATFANNDAAIMRILKSGHITIGVSGDQAPFVMHDAQGQLMGYDIDLANTLAQTMGVKSQFKTMAFKQLLPALNKGEVDIVISGMNITLERAQHILFAGPYTMAGKSVLTKSSTLAQDSKANHYNTSEIKVAALKNSTSEEFVKTFMPTAKYTAVEHYEEGLLMVKSAQVDIMVADMQFCILAVLLNPNDKLITLEQPLSMEPIGIAVSRQNISLHSALQNYLDAYRTVGLFKELDKKWFKDGSWVTQLPNKTIAM